MKILLVEDDNRISDVLAEALIDQNYTVDIAEDGSMGWEFVMAFPYDLIVLDLMLPKLDGISLCQQLRQKGYSTPVLMLTAKDASFDKVIGLDAGADDYVVKPFDLPELMARIRALLRRIDTSLPLILEWGGLHLDPNTFNTSYLENTLHLTPTEYRILELFLRNVHKTWNRSEILEHLWSLNEPPGEETVKVHIRSLRQKLRSAGADADFIETVYGMGYRLKQIL
jgi:two-component system, OmpR family, response regulator